MNHDKSPGRPVLAKRFFWPSLFALIVLLSACRPQIPGSKKSASFVRAEPSSALIAFVGTDGNIYTIDHRGENQVAVTEDAQLSGVGGQIRYYQFPSWAPDGRNLAFIGIQGVRGTTLQAGLFTASADGQNLIEAFTSTEEFPFYLYWSPDSQQVSFLTTSADEATLMLQVVPVRGGDARILDTGQPYYWVWAPDGQRMLVHVGGNQGHLSVLTLGSEIVEENLQLDPINFQAPDWSPDGKQLMLATKTAEHEQALVLTDQLGRFQRTVTGFEGSIAFDWSPDGKKLAYIPSAVQAVAGVLGPLAVQNVDEMDETKTSEQKTVLAFFWSPDSEKIAYFVPVFTAPTEGPTALVQNVEPTLHLALYIMDMDSGTADQVLVFLPTEQFLNVLPYFDQYQHSATLWSPSSEQLVISGYTLSNEARIWIVDVAGGNELRVLADGVFAFWSWK